MKTNQLPRAAVALAAALGVLFACGGQIEIGQGRNPLTGDPCDPSQCGANTLCPSGTPTDVVCSRYNGGACAWSGKCPGDCDPSKCANDQGACAYGTPTNLRCVPSPYAGQGSAPPDMCEIRFDCTGSPPVDASPDVITSVDASVCSMDKCHDQGFACSTGPATNLRCVPDPNAGVGSDPVGHCILLGDCPSDADVTAPGFDASASADVSVD